MNLSEKIKKYRSLKNLTQKSLASLLFVSRKTVSGWENNRSVPDIGNIVKMSKIFNISIEEFLNDDMIKHYNEENKLYKHNMLIRKITYILNIFLLIGVYLHLFRLIYYPPILIIFILNIIVFLVCSYYNISFKNKKPLILYPIILLLTFITNIFNISLWDRLSKNNISYDYGLILSNFMINIVIALSIICLIFLNPFLKKRG